MRKFSEQYCKGTDTYFCSEKSVTAVVIQGLAEHKRDLGYPLCPCRHYDDKQQEAQMGYWNCPCVPMRERKVRRQHKRIATRPLTALTYGERHTMPGAEQG
jgi:ferredoxin-thioredoxin reductase catalytic chain